MDLLIRFAKMEDAEELLALYTPYVTDTVITFEYEVPSLDEFKDRMRQTMKKYPYLVAEQKGHSKVVWHMTGQWKRQFI